MLTDDDIALIINTSHSRYDLAQKIIAAYEAKLREEKPTIYIQPNHLGLAKHQVFLCRAAPCQIHDDFVPLFEHPAPIPEGLLDLLAIIHRDGGHYTDEHGIDKAINDAKDKVWAMLAAARSGE